MLCIISAFKLGMRGAGGNRSVSPPVIYNYRLSFVIVTIRYAQQLLTMSHGELHDSTSHNGTCYVNYASLRHTALSLPGYVTALDLV